MITKDNIILVIMIVIFISAVSAIILNLDYNKSECRSIDSFSVKIHIKKLCSITEGGSFTYSTNSWFFSEKECEVEYKC